MSLHPFQALACPLDRQALQREGARLRCPSGHSFDIAREGYTYLLPVQNKRSRDPGDSKEMVAARRRFLNAGHYQRIAAAVCAALLRDTPDATPEAEPLSCLDAGCGEGYYLRALAGATARPLAVLGLDISKWAVLAAAKQERLGTWVVGSNANLPVQSHSLDLVLCMFGFPVYPEFARVLRPGGILLQVDSGPDHLRELREIIYPSLKPERDRAPPVPDGFAITHTETLRFALSLSTPDAIADLLLMTPHLFRASAEGKAKAAALETLALTVDVRLQTFARQPLE
jgi:23S rRNA (guanine745-N1)-methyltransferase